MERTGFIGVASAGSLKNKGDEVLPGSIAVARGFANLLVSTRALCHQSLYCHWQATEPEFKGLHSLFEQHYQSLRKATDIIANRINELGYELPNHFSKPAWGTGLDDTGPPEEMIGGLIRNHGKCAQASRKVMHIAENAGDELSAHIAAQRLSVHEKSMLLLQTLAEIEKPTRSLM